jgi:hypothetical protein
MKLISIIRVAQMRLAIARSSLTGLCIALGVAMTLFGGQPSRAADTDLSRPIHFELDIGTFDVPYGYLQGRPPLFVFDKPRR